MEKVFKECLLEYQKTVKTERTKYFSDLIENNHHRPKVLFQTLNNGINPTDTACYNITAIKCENFLTFFIIKINDRVLITPPAHGPSVPPVWLTVLNQFNPVSLSHLHDIIIHLKPTYCPLDIVPARLIKETFNTIGPTVLKMINRSLETGIFPDVLKHALSSPY